MRWALLLLFVVAFDASGTDFYATTSRLASFTDAGQPGDNDWDDQTFATLGSGEYRVISDPTSETASHILFGSPDGARRVVMEFDVSGTTAIENSFLNIYFDVVSADMVLEVYGYVGDGTPTADDADISDKDLLGSYPIPENLFARGAMPLAAFNVTNFVQQLITSGEENLGFVVRIKDDTTESGKFATLWTGEVKHDYTNRDGPQLSVLCVPNCPEAVVTYQPTLPEPGDYPNIPAGICEPPDDTNLVKVTLTDGQSLGAAFEELKALDFADNGVYDGGTLYVPHDVDTVQCEEYPRAGVNGIYMRLPKSNLNPNGHSWKIKGIKGPNGERPRFYCRGAERREGTISTEELAGFFLYLFDDDDRNVKTTFTIESLHIDGYKDHIRRSDMERFIFRDNYMHHGLGDGITSSNLVDGTYSHVSEVCGNEISHTGADNKEHGMYMHGGRHHYAFRPEDAKRTGTVHLYYNYMHSAAFSSNYKSIANYNYIKYNKFATRAITDPSYREYTSQFLVDVLSCGVNEIMHNEFIGYKDTSNQALMIGIRNRMTNVQGCDFPTIYEYNDDPNISLAENLRYIQPLTYTSEFYDEAAWQALNGERYFTTKFTNNIIRQDPRANDNKSLKVITSWGTFPNNDKEYARRTWNQAPANWYERSVVQYGDNQYYGYTQDQLYTDAVEYDCNLVSLGCPYEDTSLPYPQGEDTDPPYYPGGLETGGNKDFVSPDADPMYQFEAIGTDTLN